MNRRKLLAFIGLSPLVPLAAKAGTISTSPSAIRDTFPVKWHSDGRMVVFTGNGKPIGTISVAASTTRYGHFSDPHLRTLVCENHPDKAWPEGCSCGPGMRPIST